MKTVSLKILIHVRNGREQVMLQQALVDTALKVPKLVSWQPVLDVFGNDIGECHLEISDVED